MTFRFSLRGAGTAALLSEPRRWLSRPKWVLAVVVALGLFPLLLPAVANHQPTALLPATLTLAAVLLTQRVIVSMIFGVLVGSFVVHGPLLALPKGLESYVWARITDPTNLYISGFALSVLLTVKLTEASGGMLGLIAPLKRRLRTPRTTILGSAFLGLLVFFDDYANTLLLGPSLRPTTDSMGISRQKLAYVIDSTAAPVAGIAVVSTWLGYEVGLLETAAREVGLEQGGYSLLLQALPGRFYCLFALSLVFVVGFLGRDWGPMLRAEKAARRRLVEHPKAELPEQPRWLWLNAALPIGVLTAATGLGFFIDGGGFQRLQLEASPTSLAFWQETFKASRNGPMVLARAGGLALLTAVTSSWISGRLDLRGILAALRGGARTLAVPIGILYCAWAMGAVSRDLGTGAYLVGALGEGLHPALVPLLTFLSAAAIAFATGTSWGTMAILIPAVFPLAFHLGGLALLVPVVAAVLDGAIFGDHCSPLSDTTVLSAAACDCDALSHVTTQLPYALCAMVVAALAYLAGGAFSLPSLALYGAGTVLLVVFVRVFGKSPDADPAGG